jgi:phage terminase large subunit-like protein
MNDHDLKNALQETCPVLPGQEARAWKLLQERMAGPAPAAWLSWRALAGYGVGLAALALLAVHASGPVVVPVSASSQAPGIFATAFYSQPAHAQVVWLNGMEPATDGPTYMDRTGKVDARAAQPSSPGSL